MQTDTHKVFCQTHKKKFTIPQSSKEAVCKTGETKHAVVADFVNTKNLFYCCECEHFWIAEFTAMEFSGKCPSCGAKEKPHYYCCDNCHVTMMDFSASKQAKTFYIMPWGHPHPHCPGCLQSPTAIPQTHFCQRLRGLMTTARPACPYCEEDAIESVPAASVEARETQPFAPAAKDESANESPVESPVESPPAPAPSPVISSAPVVSEHTRRLEKIIFELEQLAQQEESKRKAAEEKAAVYALQVATLEQKIKRCEETAGAELSRVLAQAETQIRHAELQAEEARGSLEELGRRFREKGERYQAEFQRLRKEVDQFALLARDPQRAQQIIPLTGDAPANGSLQQLEKKYQAEIKRIVSESTAVLKEVESFARRKEVLLVQKLNETEERARMAELKYEQARREIVVTKSKIELLEKAIRTANGAAPRPDAAHSRDKFSPARQEAHSLRERPTAAREYPARKQ